MFQPLKRKPCRPVGHSLFTLCHQTMDLAGHKLCHRPFRFKVSPFNCSTNLLATPAISCRFVMRSFDERGYKLHSYSVSADLWTYPRGHLSLFMVLVSWTSDAVGVDVPIGLSAFHQAANLGSKLWPTADEPLLGHNMRYVPKYLQSPFTPHFAAKIELLPSPIFSCTAFPSPAT